MAPGETPDQAGQELMRLATTQFNRLSDAEANLLRAVPKGEWAVCGSSSDFDDATNDPAKADEWGPEREVHAGLIRWLSVDPAAADRVDPIGIHLFGARITGILDLSFVCVPFPLRLFRCRLAQEVLLRSAQLPALYLNGSRTGPIRADGLSVRGYLFLSDGFTAGGEVRLPGAQIGGGLDCSHGRFKNPPQKDVIASGKALIADGANVKGAVFLSDRFTAEGEVRFVGAEIGKNFECSGGTFNNPPQKDVAGSGKALIADGANVRGSVFLNAGFAAKGEVRLVGTQIGSNLNCSRATFDNPRREDLARGGVALNADRLNIKGGVALCDGFIAEGEVRLPGARIGGELDCHGGTFSGLIILGANVAGHLLLFPIRHAAKGEIDLTNASADALFDDKTSWPASGNLRLDGFVYGRISEGPRDPETRLKWLALQPVFTPQPYRQLAKVLRESGDDRGARRILYEMEKLRRTEQSRIWRDRLHNEKLTRRSRMAAWTRYGLARGWGKVLKATIGYCFRLQRTLYWLIGLTVLGTLLFGLGYLGGSMAPTERDAYACFEKQGWPPRHYQAFNPFIYALENSVPVLKLGQDSAWAPDPGPREQERAGAVNFPPWKWAAWVSGNYLNGWVIPPPWLLRVFRWLQIVMGWMLATLFVAGVTGVVRTE